MFESLEPRLLYFGGTPFDLELITQTGDLSTDGDSITSVTQTSINQSGTVAATTFFTTGSGVVVDSGAGAPVRVTFPPSSSRNFGFGQINDSGLVAARESISGNSLVRTWDSNSPGSFNIIAATTDTNYLSTTLPSIANDNTFSFVGLNQFADAFLYTNTSGIRNDETLVGSLSGGGHRPFAASNGRVVDRSGDANSTITLYSTTGSTLIASPGTGYSALGRSPGITEDASAIAFVADETAVTSGDGIFVSFDDGGGTRSIIRVAGISGNGLLDPGEVHNDLNTDSIVDVGEDEEGFSSIDNSFSRVGVSRTGDTLRVVYIATAADTGVTGLFYSEIDVTNPSSPSIGTPSIVASVGDVLPNSAVTISSINLYDPISADQIVFGAGLSTGGTAAIRATIASAPADVEVTQFKQSPTDPGKLVVTYEVSGTIDPNDGFELELFKSSDNAWGVSDSAAGDRILVTPSQITSNAWLELSSDSGDANKALDPGVHELVIDVDAGQSDTDAWASALEDETAAFVLVVADPQDMLDETGVAGGEDNNDAPFEGFFQETSSSRAVVRTEFGSANADSIDLASGGVLDVNGTTENIGSATELLVVAMDGNNFVHVESALTTDLIAITGPGNDKIIGGSGDDIIEAGDGDNIVLGEGFGLNTTTLDQFLDDLALGNFTVGASIAPTGSGQDTITTGSGFDVVLGGPGSDTIHTGDGVSLVFGDSFGAGVSATIDLVTLLATAAISDLKNALDQALETEFTIGLAGTGDDTITGGNSLDLVFGGDGVDTIDGAGGFGDVVFGGAGNDVISASATQFLYAEGGAGNDTITGGTDGSFLVGGDGDDTLNGGASVDILFGDDFDLGSSTEFAAFMKNLEDKKIEANVTITPMFAGNDMLYGNDGFDILIGGSGNDTLESGAGGGVLIGDEITTNATFSLDLNALFANNGDDDKTRVTDNFTDALAIEGSILTLTGNGNDTLTGGAGLDLILGGDGIDTATGGGAADLVLLHDGDDSLDASASTFVIAFGGEGDDDMTGASAVSYLVGENGNDTLTGGAGLDVLIGDSFKFKLNGQEDLYEGFKGFLTALEERKLNFVVEAEAIGTGDDTLDGGDFFDILIGGSGVDTLTGGAGGGLLFGDSFNAKAGPSDVGFDDVFDDDDDSGDPKNDDPATQTKKKNKAKSLWSKFLTLLGTPEFELVGSGNDSITGGSGIDFIFGGAGNDTASGGAGGSFTDVLIGNEGNDTLQAHSTWFSILIGGDGTDTLEGSLVPGSLGSIQLGDDFSFLGVPANLASMFTFDFDGILPVQLGIKTGVVQQGTGDDNMLGSDGGFNIMFGGDGDDTLEGAGLFDVMFGDSLNLGTDISIDFSGLSLNKTIQENFDAIDTQFELPGLAGSGNDTITGGAGEFNLAIGGDGNDTITGGTGALDLLFGNGDDDTIDGLGGFNVIVGGRNTNEAGPGPAGSDILTGGDDGNFILGDTYDFNTANTIFFNSIKDGEIKSGTGLIPSGSGNDQITSGSGLDVIIAGSGDDTVSPGDGFNVVLGDAFTIGLNPYDFASAFNSALKATIFGDPNAALNAALAALGFSGTGNDTINGGGDTDIVFGGNGNDVINGGGSGLTEFDFLVGGEGNDTLNGQSGDDVVFGGLGDDQLDGEDGNDHLESEEGDDTFFGGAGNDRIFAGIGADELYGGTGDDELFGEGGNDLLDGGDGTDTLDGGFGTDTFVDGEVIVDPKLPADLDDDGDVDGVDLGLLFATFTGPNNGPPPNPEGDLDGDNDVDGVDLGIAFGLFTGPLSPAAPASTQPQAILALSSDEPDPFNDLSDRMLQSALGYTTQTDVLQQHTQRLRDANVQMQERIQGLLADEKEPDNLDWAIQTSTQPQFTT